MPTTTSPFGQLTLRPARFPRTGAKLARQARAWLSIFGFASLLMVGASASAQLLGAAQSYAVLGGTSVTVGGGGATVNGDLGVSPGTSITGGPSVTAPYGVHNNDQPAIDARAAWVPLNNSLLAGTCTPLSSDQLAGQTLVPGCYSGGALNLASNGTLTLNGAGTYLFRAASSLITGTGSTVALIGVNPCSVFWQVTSLATLDGASFPGTVVAATGVHLGTGSSLTGRALAGVGGDVTMAGGNSVGSCSAQGAGTPTLTRPIAPPDVPLGTPINDVKTLAGGAGTPQGTITFDLYAPNDLNCTGAVIFTSTVSVDGNGVYTSASYTPLAIGTYRWIANYGGDNNNAATANACNAPNESVIVTGAIGVASIPTLSEWAMLALVGLMAVVGFVAMRRRMR